MLRCQSRFKTVSLLLRHPQASNLLLFLKITPHDFATNTYQVWNRQRPLSQMEASQAVVPSLNAVLFFLALVASSFWPDRVLLVDGLQLFYNSFHGPSHLRLYNLLYLVMQPCLPSLPCLVVPTSRCGQGSAVQIRPSPSYTKMQY